MPNLRGGRCYNPFMTFSHLHVHSEYSLLDGFSNIRKLVRRVQELGMTSIALTDHGTMFGIIEFYQAANAAGIKPIIGLEAYLSPRRMTDRDSKLDKTAHHLLLLAENQTGYQNLLKIASAAQLEGFYYHPRIDHEFLEKHAEGLIATSGCMAAEIPRIIRNQGVEAARQRLDWYYDVFGKDNFFLELQQHDIPELDELNHALVNLGPRYQARYVATNDTHYINPEDAHLQDVLLAIQTGSLLNNPDRMRMSGSSYYLRSPEEMASLFAEVPESISNTLLIAERCNVDLSVDQYHLPDFTLPDGYTHQSYLRELCEKGFTRRYGERANDDRYRERLEYELGVIHTMGFDTYFLIVWDLCRYAREQGIWYNARGSAAGSMVAYTLDITLVEPIEHGLIFERFLNPGRISMPDIDLDFQDDLRSRMLEYCARHYGDDRVAQIITFGTMGSRGAIRDVGRVMDIPLSEVDRIAKLMPSIPNKGSSIKEALETSVELKLAYDSTPYIRDLIDTASRMEGAVRNAGTHAAGVIITDQPIINLVPLHRPTSGSEDSPIKIVTQFDMNVLDALRLLKVDFLGLATLTIMNRACELINKRHGINFNLQNIPVDDPETFEFIGKGHTAGVFQLEGAGMTRYIMQMKPKNLANVIAMVALFRPGPMDFIPTYIRRMHGEEPVQYDHPLLEPIFKETFGIPIYQEQIMFAAMELAGYTASEADELRKAISKKKADALLKHRQKFVSGAAEKNVPQATAAAIFENWENFARYGFNKSHAADYGVIAVQTAYLKTHFTLEFMTALLSASKNDIEKIAWYIADARTMGIGVLPPDVNFGGWDFTVEECGDCKSAIRFGLGAVKNVGQNPVEMILEARGGKPFADLNDFARRVDLSRVGKRSLEGMIKVGALDSFGPRAALLEAMDTILSVSSSHFSALNSGQLSFFGSIAGVEETINLPRVNGVDKAQMLEWERELIGLYVSDHPLTPYLPILKRRVTHYSGQLGEVDKKDKVTVAGMVKTIRSHFTKDGKPMAFVGLEDAQGAIECILFPRAYTQYIPQVEIGRVICAEGKVDAEGKVPKILVDQLSRITLDDMAEADAAPAGSESGPSRDNHLANESGDDTPVLDSFDDPPPPEVVDWYMLESPAPARQVKEPAPPSVEDPQNLTNAPTAAAAPPKEDPLPEVLSETKPIPNPAAPEMLPPIMENLPRSNGARILTVTIHPTGDRSRDNRRLTQVHNLLCSNSGADRFCFIVFEGGHRYLLDFPNETTGIDQEVLSHLGRMVGEENISVEKLAG